MNILKQFAAWVDGNERELWCSPAPARKKNAPPKRAIEKQPKKLTKAEKTRIFNAIYYTCCVIMSMVMIAVLVACVLNLPEFGKAGNPTNNELSQYYIEHGLEDAGAINLVGNMILSYRVFDTFGESCVLFLAASSVMMLLSRDSKNTRWKLLRAFEIEDTAEFEAKDRLLRTVTRLVLPFIFLFGVYVILNGHLSPGGGFAGGSVLGAGLILYAQEFGNVGVRQFFTEHLYHIIKVTALAIYGLILLYYAFMGVNGLDNHIWLGITGTILSSGIIMPINFLVGFEVACTIYAFYALFHKGEI